MDHWNDVHEDYARNHLYIDQEEPRIPWTFRAENAADRLTEINLNLYLLRVEEATWPCELNGTNPEELDERIKACENGDQGART